MGSAKSQGSEDTSGTHVWLVLMKAYRALLRHAEASFADLDICLSDFVVLEMLLNKGPQKVNDIGRKIALTSGSITSAVDRLEDLGLVSREVDREDKRARIVHLTPKGRALIRAAFDVHASRMEKAADGLGRTERTTLMTLLKKLGLNAQAQLDGEKEQADE